MWAFLLFATIARTGARLAAAPAPGAADDRQGPGEVSLVLSILGPGNSSSNAALGTQVLLQVRCSPSSAACPPWVRVDRTDGTADSSPLVRVVDEVGAAAVCLPAVPPLPLLLDGLRCCTSASPPAYSSIPCK